MIVKYQSRRALLYLAASVVAFGLVAVAPTQASAEAVTMTVTAVAKKQAPVPPLKKEDIELYQGKERMQVSDWRRGDTLFLAVLIDDSLETDVANQWNDLRAFINAQPKSSSSAAAFSFAPGTFCKIQRSFKPLKYVLSGSPVCARKRS